MGCDIHTYREKFVDGGWITADEWEAYDYGDDEKGISVPYKKQAFHGRNYDLFGLIAKGVRRDFDFGIPLRGVAFDACPEYMTQVDEESGHSFSYLYLHELKALRRWVDTASIPVSGMMGAEQAERLQAAIAKGEDAMQHLYPYCQWTSDETAVHFSVDLPMVGIVGGSLDKLIASFDGIEGENHRLSFFFDN